jgi:hypothetical protein
VDRNIIRLAAWELTNGQTPPKVTIDEAIEMAKEFSTEQSAAFVNGVLDAMLKENQNLTAMPVVEPAVEEKPGQEEEVSHRDAEEDSG